MDPASDPRDADTQHRSWFARYKRTTKAANIKATDVETMLVEALALRASHGECPVAAHVTTHERVWHTALELCARKTPARRTLSASDDDQTATIQQLVVKVIQKTVGQAPRSVSADMVESLRQRGFLIAALPEAIKCMPLPDGLQLLEALSSCCRINDVCGH